MRDFGKILWSVLLVATCLVVQAASAQVISSDLFPKQTLTAEDQQQIQSVVLAHVQRLGGGDVTVQRNSRRALMAPLQSPNASAAFRLAYSRIAVEPLLRLIDSEKVDVALSAIQILGWIATDASVEALLPVLRHDVEARRYAAADALRRTFLLSTGEQSASPAATVWKAVRRLMSLLPEEQSPYVVRAMVSALLASPRESAGVELAGSLNQRLAGPMQQDVESGEVNQFLVDAYIAAAYGLRVQLIQPDQSSVELFTAAAELGARFLVWSYCMHAQPVTDQAIDLAPLAEAGEQLLAIAHLSRSGQQRGEVIASIVKQRGWPGMREAVLEWVGEEGLLHKRPYDFAPGAFVRGTCLAD